MLIILRGTQKAFGWSLFDGGYTFATKIAAAAAEFNDQYKAGAYIAAGLVLFLLTFVVNCDGARRRRRQGHPMTSTLDRPLKARDIQGVSLRRQLAQRDRDRAGDAVGGGRAGTAGLGALFGGRQRFQRRHVKRVVDAFPSRHDGILYAGGGAYHAIVGTLLQGLVCAVISVPIGIFVAIYLVEYGGGTPLGKLTTFMVDILTGVPSIVAALFIYALWIATLGFPRSGFAVSLALVLLMLPVIVRATEEMLRIVPDGPARGQPTRWACRSGKPSRAS